MDTLAADFNDDLSSTSRMPSSPTTSRSERLNAVVARDDLARPERPLPVQGPHRPAQRPLLRPRLMMNYAVSKPEYRNCVTRSSSPTVAACGTPSLYRAAEHPALRAHPHLGRLRPKAGEAPPPALHRPVRQVEKQALAKYKAMGLDPKTADFIDEKLFRLVELRLNVKGIRY